LRIFIGWFGVGFVVWFGCGCGGFFAASAIVPVWVWVCVLVGGCGAAIHAPPLVFRACFLHRAIMRGMAGGN